MFLVSTSAMAAMVWGVFFAFPAARGGPNMPRSSPLWHLAAGSTGEHQPRWGDPLHPCCSPVTIHQVEAEAKLKRSQAFFILQVHMDQTIPAYPSSSQNAMWQDAKTFSQLISTSEWHFAKRCKLHGHPTDSPGAHLRWNKPGVEAFFCWSLECGVSALSAMVLDSAAFRKNWPLAIPCVFCQGA